jgi:hypothetical protein
MNQAQAQQLIRTLSPSYLAKEVAKNPGISVVLDAFTKHLAPAKTVPKPSTLDELSEALRHPLPLPPVPPTCRNALEAFAAYKPLTMEMVRDLMAKERAARDVLMKEYTERTGQAVDYCDACNLGVVETEVEGTWPVVVNPVPCEVCDGLGVIQLFPSREKHSKGRS